MITLQKLKYFLIVAGFQLVLMLFQSISSPISCTLLLDWGTSGTIKKFISEIITLEIHLGEILRS